MHLLAGDPGQRYFVLSASDPERGEISIEEMTNYDAATQIRHVMWYFSAPGEADFRVIDYRLRVIFPQELLLLLKAVGFRLETRYGDFSRAPFESSSPHQVCACSLRS